MLSSSTPGSPAAQQAPVLVVEDDATIAFAIRSALEDEGMSVIVASTVAEATGVFDRARPSLVLLDWNLPDGSGEDVVRAIRPMDASVPIVVMSAAREALRASWVCDARKRVEKPVDLDRIVALVQRHRRE